jgi:hypothetical protein
MEHSLLICNEPSPVQSEQQQQQGQGQQQQGQGQGQEQEEVAVAVKQWSAGEAIDALDVSTNIYCPARVVKKISNESYRVHWLGWPETFDEELSPDLMFPLGKFVLKTRAWVKLDKKIGWWPAILYLR